jgi:NADH-quinone oxidoreductase subunit L
VAALAGISWLAVAVPVLIAAAILALGSRGLRFSMLLAPLGPLVGVAVGVAGLSAEGGAPVTAIDWLIAQTPGLRIGVGADSLGSVMLLVVGIVSAAVMVYSVGYMAGDPARPRYFAAMSLFTGAMNAVVLSVSLLGLFVAWELVGVCSYLLIGFWHARPAAARAAMKAFVVTRVGDVGLLLAIAVLWREIGSLWIPDVIAAASSLDPGVAMTVAALLFLAAAGKSAQFPFHIWLPDAMEGPTPVSALIHAATMVAAGIFLLARMWPVFAVAEGIWWLLLAVGALTALGAAAVASTQTDIKAVLAYSTISQLGFMTAALGAGAPAAAIFHLVTHGAFKALLFLAAGSVIHTLGVQDMRSMGGLSSRMPRTTALWIVGGAALAGIPPLAGFFSKDAVLHEVFSASPIAGAALFGAALLTAFYVTRATVLVFFGTARQPHSAHESGPAMLVPMLALALPALALGLLTGPITAALGGEAHLGIATALASTAVVVLGVGIGWLAYRCGLGFDTTLDGRLGGVYRLARNAWGVDALVDRVVARRAGVLAERLHRSFDVRIVDALAEGTARLSQRIGRVMASLQSGEVDLYSGLIVIGVVLLVAVAFRLGG